LWIGLPETNLQSFRPVKDFFKKGYEQSKISIDDANRLLHIIKSEEFTKSNNYNEDKNLNPPEISYRPSACILAECQKWFGKNLLNVQSMFGIFDYFFCTINKFTKSKGMPWHNDHIDGTFLTTLIYLTDHKWEDDYGGCLELGYIEEAENLIEPRLRPNQYNLVKKIGRVTPTHGTVVTINNIHLPFCHRVSEMDTDAVRYTLMFHAGFCNNTANARKYFGSNGKIIREGS